jgi:hypothetical protein
MNADEAETTRLIGSSPALCAKAPLLRTGPISDVAAVTVGVHGESAPLYSRPSKPATAELATYRNGAEALGEAPRRTLNAAGT